MVEADFYREYKINLSEVFYTLSWRRFMNLFSGLSKDSSFFTVILHHKQNAPIDDDPFALAKAMKADMRGGRKKKEPNRMVTH